MDASIVELSSDAFLCRHRFDPVGDESPVAAAVTVGRELIDVERVPANVPRRTAVRVHTWPESGAGTRAPPGFIWGK
jgi:hypothetical protein